MADLKWPTSAAGGSDLEAPLVELIKGLDLQSVQSTGDGVIQSDVLDVTKSVQSLLKGVGGFSAIAGGASSAWAQANHHTSLAIALIAAAGVILAASVLGIAKVIDGDIRGRAAVTTEQTKARATVAAGYLESTAKLSQPAAPATTPASPPPTSGSTVSANTTRTLADDLWAVLGAFGERVEVQTTVGGDGWSHFRALNRGGTGGLRIELADHDNIALDEVTAFRVQRLPHAG